MQIRLDSKLNISYMQKFNTSSTQISYLTLSLIKISMHKFFANIVIHFTKWFLPKNERAKIFQDENILKKYTYKKSQILKVNKMLR